MLFLQLCLLTFYLTRSLTFIKKVDHFGPFPSSKKFVTILEDHYNQPVTLFDWIRRLTPFNPYLVTGDLWVVNKRKMEVWTCPFCLSFWVAFIATAILGLTVQHNLLLLITAHYAIASVSAILNYFVNYLVEYVQLRSDSK